MDEDIQKRENAFNIKRGVKWVLGERGLFASWGDPGLFAALTAPLPVHPPFLAVVAACADTM